MARKRILIRRDTSANWENNNPTLAVGEFGLETDTNRIKMGTGEPWNDIFSFVEPSSFSIQDSLEQYILLSEKGNPDGVASLNSFGKIPLDQIPDDISLDAEIDSAILAASSNYDPVGSAATAELNANLYTDAKETSITSAYQAYADQSELDAKAYTDTTISALTTDDITEGSNEYFTNQKVLDALPPLFDGDYNSLTNTPSLFSGSYNDLSNKPNLFSGSYTDLTDAPTLFDGDYNSLSNKPDLSIYSTISYVDSEISNLVAAAPETLNTLNELAAALGNDENYATTISNQIGLKLDSSTAASTYAPINSPTFTGTVSGITASMIGLGNVDNTSDIDKYLSEYISDTSTARTINSSTDKFNTIEFSSSSSITVTIPNDTQDSGWEIGSSLEIRQVGSGQITITKDAAVTLNAPEDQLKTRVQWSTLFLEKRAANTWLVSGDATA